MYVSKYTVDILIVENTAKFGLYFLISPQIIQSSGRACHAASTTTNWL